MKITEIEPISYLEEIYVKVLSQLYSSLEFDDRKKILGVSDYSGDTKKDNYFVNSFLITSIEEGGMHVSRMREFRNTEPHLPDNSFFEYKGIWQDNLRRRLLPKYLNICEKISGLLVVFLIEKNCDWFGSLKNKKLADEISQLGMGNWAPHVIRKLMETFILMAFLVSKFQSKNKDFVWLSDRDSRFGDNEEQKRNSRKILKTILDSFNVEFNNISTYLQFGHTPDEDLNSIVDIASGSLLDVLDYQDKCRSTSLEYLKWFSDEGGLLKKVAISVTKNGNQIRATELKYKDNTAHNNM